MIEEPAVTIKVLEITCSWAKELPLEFLEPKKEEKDKDKVEEAEAQP